MVYVFLLYLYFDLYLVVKFVEQLEERTHINVKDGDRERCDFKYVLYLNISIQKEREKSENEKDKRSGENTSSLNIDGEQPESVIRQNERERYVGCCMIVVCCIYICYCR